MNNFEIEGQNSFKPLNLPQGSIRAALTLSIAFTTVYLAIFFPEVVPESLRNVFIVSVAFYYSSRATIQPSSPVVKEKSQEKPPLFLPTATVRISLAITTAIAIAITLFDKNEVPSFMLTVMITILGFSLGMIVRVTVAEITSLFKPRTGPPRFNFKEIFGHLQAAGILLTVVGVCLFNVVFALSLLPIDIGVITFLNQFLELVVGYYFGSRISKTL
ncbi:MAG: hypothetical protein ACW98F_05265 [Candidatus Hodarchaeales archaeon]|jgi:hypothetical protein